MQTDIITAQALRKRPAWQLVALMRERRVSQTAVAKRLRLSQGYVSEVINRRRREGKNVERVWGELERVLANGA